jgi:hypothetical protein
MPAEEAVNHIEEAPPPIYQLLYDAPVLSETQYALQRVRILMWLVHLDLSTTQLNALEQLRATTQERRGALIAAERAAAQEQEPQEQAVYDVLFEALQQGIPLDDPSLAGQMATLTALRTSDGDTSRVQLRLEAMRATMSVLGDFIRTLSQTQENMIADALFFLRNQLDPVGNPGDFNALVGTLYEPGQYAVLTRGTGEEALKPLNIGGLWSDNPGLTGRTLHNAQREVILYLALLEPGMEEAIQAALVLRQGSAPAQ